MAITLLALSNDHAAAKGRSSAEQQPFGTDLRPPDQRLSSNQLVQHHKVYDCLASSRNLLYVMFSISSVLHMPQTSLATACPGGKHHSS